MVFAWIYAEMDFTQIQLIIGVMIAIPLALLVTDLLQQIV
jgi:hypothetical protein